MSILASSVASDQERLAELLTLDALIEPMPAPMAALLGSGIHAITLGSRIFVSPERYEAVVAGEDLELVAHELVHVHQWADEGPCRFLVSYIGDYATFRLMGLDHSTAYRCIRFETEAYDRASRIFSEQ
ncbi:MAG: eCIS core domain-containing protein [Acidimicrobiia bacterium]